MNVLAQAAQLETLHTALLFVTNWSTAIDGGAYRGEWTAVMAKRFAAVHAFEPASDIIDDLRQRFTGDDKVHVHHAALWHEAERVALLPDPEHPLKHFGRHVRPGGDIPAIALDALEFESCGLIKLDLEGAELLALKGARRTLKRCRPVVICECKPRMAARYDATADDPGLFLAGLGYREAARIKPDRIFVWAKP